MGVEIKQRAGGKHLGQIQEEIKAYKIDDQIFKTMVSLNKINTKLNVLMAAVLFLIGVIYGK